MKVRKINDYHVWYRISKRDINKIKLLNSHNFYNYYISKLAGGLVIN